MYTKRLHRVASYVTAGLRHWDTGNLSLQVGLTNWNTPIMLATGRLKQEDYELEGNSGHLGRLCLKTLTKASCQPCCEEAHTNKSGM